MTCDVWAKLQNLGLIALLCVCEARKDRAAGTYGDAWTGPNKFFANKLILFQSGGANYAHQVGLSPPNFLTFRPSPLTGKQQQTKAGSS